MAHYTVLFSSLVFLPQCLVPVRLDFVPMLWRTCQKFAFFFFVFLVPVLNITAAEKYLGLSLSLSAVSFSPSLLCPY